MADANTMLILTGVVAVRILDVTAASARGDACGISSYVMFTTDALNAMAAEGRPLSKTCAMPLLELPVASMKSEYAPQLRAI